MHTPHLPPPTLWREQRPFETNSRCCFRKFWDHVRLCHVLMPPPPPSEHHLVLFLSNFGNVVLVLQGEGRVGRVGGSITRVSMGQSCALRPGAQTQL